MTDKELLELAAKAVGYTCIEWVEPDKYSQSILTESGYFDCDDGIGIPFAWNPLTDDGDALRLAVKLELGVAVYDDRVDVQDGYGCFIYERIDSDPYAATRRAIVRAAAEIGRVK